MCVRDWAGVCVGGQVLIESGRVSSRYYEGCDPGSIGDGLAFNVCLFESTTGSVCRASLIQDAASDHDDVVAVRIFAC